MGHRRLGAGLFAGTVAVGLAATGVWAQRHDDDDDDKRMFEFAAPIMASPAADMMGATPGGAQDIAYARDRIAAGEVPHPETFTPEGLFSEHDLPLETGRACKQVVCLTAAATPAELIAQPEVRHLAQIGFASNLDARTWKRPPMNLVAVIDKSGSMSGQPLDTVRASLHQLVRQLGPEDQIAVVLYGDRTHLHLPPTLVKDRAALDRAIDAIESAGSTNMEDGLKLGFQIAERSAAAFEGVTRVMLFTDERPNVGATDAGSFMGMARAHSAKGIGMTTIGVGAHFGAELATAISSVRGGNLFFFPDHEAMVTKFTDDLDTMLIALAYDLDLEIAPAPGHRLVGLYGVPGDLVKRRPDGGLSMRVETIFLSKQKGAIFLAFAPHGGGALPPAPGPLGTVRVAYTGVDRAAHTDALAITSWTDGPLPLGLARGRLLVDEVTTLRAAAEAHLSGNDQEKAWQLVRALRQKFAQTDVPGLDGERAVIDHLHTTLSRLSGHQGEGASVAVGRDPIDGLPR